VFIGDVIVTNLAATSGMSTRHSIHASGASTVSGETLVAPPGPVTCERTTKRFLARS
jgi:hypothetical protein